MLIPEARFRKHLTPPARGPTRRHEAYTKLGLPTALVAPITFVLDLLANAKVITALAAVAVVARARRVAKA